MCLLRVHPPVCSHDSLTHSTLALRLLFCTRHAVTEQHGGEPHDVEWEDNWDDEVEGENEFAKRLRAELEKNKELPSN